MKKGSEMLILDLPLAGKAEGLLYSAGAGISAGGLSAKFVPLAFGLLGFHNLEPVALFSGALAMAWAAASTSDILSPDLARKHGLILRTYNAPKWHIKRPHFLS